MYADTDNLYEWDMSSYPLTGGFEWINTDLTNLGDPCSEDDQGFILEVDLEYLKELHDYHNDYSLAPETVQLNKVNTNGLISFFQSIRSYTSEAFPKIGERIVLAPFWADINTGGCGSTCSIWYRESTEFVDLIKATTEIRYFFPVMKQFNASWTYIATWFNVPFFGASSLGMNKRNTFQAVLITDSKSSFVIFNYNKIEWTTGTASQGNADTGLDGIPAQVGFNMGDEIHYYSVEGSRKSEIINLPNLSNVKYPGKFIFRVDLPDIESAPTPDADQCFLKAADILLVVDLSLSIDINNLKSLISDLISKLPINAMECQIAMKSFSTSAKTEFRFKDHKTNSEILAHIAKMSTVKGVSNLEDALSFTM
ncbi:sushi, nidogen and EGF-like domain-containing protein 1 [Mytilus trossulus]|uniref:sushi, nidogen and EGF-like domain-containing protein 1 n=1 Tax=Mytilus trossulus TaxID=6551 RepID=UPI0030041717